MAEKPDPDKNEWFGNDDDDEESVEDVENTANDTEKVFKEFVYRRLTSQIDKEATEGDLLVANIPSVVMNELRSVRDESLSNNDSQTTAHQQQINQLGKTLADFGDEIQWKYHSTFVDMMSRMNLSSDESFAFESFARVARRLFENGINWGRIVALLCFGYEIALHVIKQGTHGSMVRFLRKIVSYMVNFIVNEKIANWIIHHGGWARAVVDINNNDGDVWLMRGVAVIAIILASYGIFTYFSGDKS